MTQTTCPHCGADSQMSRTEYNWYECGTLVNPTDSTIDQSGSCKDAELTRLRSENEQIRARLAEVTAEMQEALSDLKGVCGLGDYDDEKKHAAIDSILRAIEKLIPAAQPTDNKQ